MPTAYIDLPPGLGAETKTKLLKEVTDLVHHAYLIPDTRVLLREWSADRYSIDGEIGAPLRPIVTFVVPPGCQSRRNASSSEGSIPPSPRPAICPGMTFRSRAARWLAQTGCSNSSANIRSTGLPSMT
jgi:hypothetical protein